MFTTRRTRRSRRRSRRRARNASYIPLINPIRRRRRRRRNSWFNHFAGHRKAALVGWRRRRRSRRKKNPSRRRQAFLFNPALTLRHGNPFRRRRSRRRYRRNPNGIGRSLKQAFSRQWIMRSLTIGGGIASGMIGMPLVYKMVPSQYRIQARPYLGLVHVVIGSLLASFVKNRNAREIGVILAGTGVYDLIAKNIPDLGLPTLPETNLLIDKFLPTPASAAAVSSSYNIARQPVSRVAAAGIASSYQAPGARTVGLSGYRSGSENPYQEVFN